jgi:excisionase family DNA binding protein
MDKLLVSIPEASRLCGLSRTSIYERLADGSILAVKAGRKTLITVESLRNFVASLPVATFNQSTEAKGR